MGIIQNSLAEMAATRAAEMQKIVEAIKRQGASEYAQGLAQLGAEQAYADTATAMPDKASAVNTSIGGRNFYMPQTDPRMSDQTAQWLNEIKARKAVQ